MDFNIFIHYGLTFKQQHMTDLPTLLFILKTQFTVHAGIYRAASMCFFVFPSLAVCNPQIIYICPLQGFQNRFVYLIFKAVHRIATRHYAINRNGVPNISELMDCFAL